MNKILIAVDGSDSSKKAAKETADLAKTMNSEVTIITVANLKFDNVNLDNAEPYLSEEQMEKLREGNRKELFDRRKEILDEVAEYFNEDELTLNKVVEYGDNVADVICNYAEENDFDLIVLADKGEGEVKRFFLGSISGKVVRYSKVSVLIIK